MTRHSKCIDPPSIRWTGLALIVSGLPAFAAAQSVSGLVLQTDGAPVIGVVVEALDTADRVQARALSGDRGAYAITGLSPGTVRLRARRIGYQPQTSESFTVARDEHRQFDIRLSQLPVILQTVRVSQQAPCSGRRPSTSDAVEAWEQARTALTASTIGAEATAQVDLAEFERTLTPQEKLIAERWQLRSVATLRPWSSVSTEALQATGYIVVDRSDSVVFRAPDAEVLASEEFRRDHCFQILTSDSAAGLEIAFEPTNNRRRIPELAGSLVLDPATLELRHLEYRYVNTDRIPGAQYAHARLEFRRAPSGAWIVNRWHLRMPVMERRTAVVSSGFRARTSTTPTLTSLLEVGGDVLAWRRGRDTLWAADAVTLSGRVVDSTTQRPIELARIGLAGHSTTATTDGRGVFSLTGIRPGVHRVEVRTPSLDSIHAVHEVHVLLPAVSTPLLLKVPSGRSLRTRVCGADHSRADDHTEGVVTGAVMGDWPIDDLRTVEVNAEWFDASRKHNISRAMAASADGAFRVCNLPLHVPIRMVARDSLGRSEAHTVTLSAASPVARIALLLKRSAIATASLVGTVVDSSGIALSGATITLPDVERDVRTNERGEFTLSRVAPGVHRVEVRRIGSVSHDTIVRVAAGDTMRLTIRLAKAVVLGEVETKADAHRTGDFEDNRRIGLGHFFTADEIAKLQPSTMADLLSATPGLRVVRPSAGPPYVVSSRPPRSLQGRPCGATRAADVYIDNVRIYAGRAYEQPFNINLLDPRTIAAIEYYAGPAQTPARYQNLDTVCGVLVIWLKR
ncbi:MAG: carboxypeptidase regulatory-like domain-containing protein [Gemmatimonadetes bacterium]|nr:carboxypeptidase regulatory-like domain-containing protein [Gemmatimonadota bacterium]